MKQDRRRWKGIESLWIEPKTPGCCAASALPPTRQPPALTILYTWMYCRAGAEMPEMLNCGGFYVLHKCIRYLCICEVHVRLATRTKFSNTGLSHMYYGWKKSHEHSLASHHKSQCLLQYKISVINTSRPSLCFCAASSKFLGNGASYRSSIGS